MATKADLEQLWKDITEGDIKPRFWFVEGRQIDMENLTDKDRAVLRKAMGDGDDKNTR